MRICVKVLDFERIALHAMLVRPHASKDARPSRSSDGVIVAVSLAHNLTSKRNRPILNEGINIGRLRLLHRIWSQTVDTDHQYVRLDCVLSLQSGISAQRD